MKLKTMKRSILVLAAAFAAMSTNAVADNAAPQAEEQATSNSVRLNDAELDGITAGTLSIMLILRTPGNMEVFHVNKRATRMICINCDALGSEWPATKAPYGMLTIERTGQAPVLRMIGKWPSF